MAATVYRLARIVTSSAVVEDTMQVTFSVHIASHLGWHKISSLQRVLKDNKMHFALPSNRGFQNS